jgi:hypothetical protein
MMTCALHGPHDKFFIALIEREVVPYRLTLTRTPLEYSMEAQRAWSGPLISPSAIVPNDGEKPRNKLAGNQALSTEFEGHTRDTRDTSQLNDLEIEDQVTP